MTNAGHGVWRTGSVPANEKEKTPMKKKLLSLALVFAMALTLLPTAAFAATSHNGADNNPCSGTITWATDATKHTGNCDVDGCPGIAEAAHTWDNTTGKCTVCEYQCTHASKTWRVDSDATKCKEVCDACGVVTTAAKTHEYSGTSGNCTNCSTEHTPHVAGDSPTYTPGAGAAAGVTHTYPCATCGKTVSENCDYTGNATKCTKCEADKPAETAKSITVSSAAFSNENKTLTVSWSATGLAENVTYSVTITGTGAPTLDNNTGLTATSYTKTFAEAVADGTYTVTVTASDGTAGRKEVTVGASQPETPDTPTTPVTPVTPENPKEDKTPPSTNSQGIPVASEVSNSTQANQAITILKNTNADTLQQRLMTSESAASSFASLESAVKSAKGIRVSVDTSASSAPSAVRSGVSVTGAAFNASGTSVRLVVDAPSSAYNISTGYQISMTMSGVSNPEKLAVPVIITLPLPSDVRADRLVVLHYHNGSSNPTTIVPVISGNSLRFTVTGFSDFVVTDTDATVGNGVSGAYTTVQGGNRGENELDALLPAIAAMLSGDGVFVDVTKEHWAAKEIRWARDGGLMSGYENGYFRPTASTTRQQLWMVLARLSGTRPADMAMARQWAINTGVSDGSNPSGVLSRQQLVTMLYRFAKSQGVNVSASAKLGGYADSAAVAPYAKEALSWAAAKGIVSGSNGKLNPEGTATRAHFAVFLYRYSHG